jgi:hypothetical protein
VDLWHALEAREFGRPQYVRYQPGRRLVVLYDSMAHLTVLTPKRTERLWAKVAGSPLAERALGGVVQRWPLDVRLPALPEARGELVRYKPGRRALFRCDGTYVKLRADGRAPVELPGTPRVLAHRPGMTVYEEVPGTPLRECERAPWMEAVAEALARLHATRIELPAHDVAVEARDLRAAAETAVAIGADPGDLAERILAALADVKPATATIHGSFHLDQVLVGDYIVLLDLDSAASGHPLFDVGEFASYLSAAGEDEARGRFLEACGAGRDALLFEAAALLRWSSLPFRDLEPEWRDKVRLRVELARERYRRSASSVITAS